MASQRDMKAPQRMEFRLWAAEFRPPKGGTSCARLHATLWCSGGAWAQDAPEGDVDDL